MSDDTYVDERGETWTRPTAEAYEKTCRALHKAKEERAAAHAACNEHVLDFETLQRFYAQLGESYDAAIRDRDDLFVQLAQARAALAEAVRTALK